MCTAVCRHDRATACRNYANGIHRDEVTFKVMDSTQGWTKVVYREEVERRNLRSQESKAVRKTRLLPIGGQDAGVTTESVKIPIHKRNYNTESKQPVNAFVIVEGLITCSLLGCAVIRSGSASFTGQI